MVPIIQELIAEPRAAGDILVFLPGLAEIRRVCQRLEPAALADRPVGAPASWLSAGRGPGSRFPAQRAPKNHRQHQRRRDIADD